MEDGFEQAAACVVGGDQAPFKPVTERHQFIDLGDDAVLFGGNCSPDLGSRMTNS